MLKISYLCGKVCSRFVSTKQQLRRGLLSLVGIRLSLLIAALMTYIEFGIMFAFLVGGSSCPVLLSGRNLCHGQSFFLILR